jgi:3'-phosphoadenosine 5'-phosphosulfate sulfotransferase (PAPS reductase)/FAD synthetase
MKWSDKVKDLTFDEKLKRSLKVLRSVAKKKDKKTPLIVNYSGGKDSTACLLLAKEVTDDVVAFYVDGGFELAETLVHIKKECKRHKVKLEVARAGVDKVSHRAGGSLDGCQNFFDYVRHYGYFPTAGRRWCSTWVKQRVMKAYWRKRFDKDVVLYKVNGVRMFESNVRLWKYGDQKHFSKYSVDGTPYLRYDAEHRPAITVLPIVEWTTDDVIEYLRRKKVKIHQGYKKYGFSGCRWCPVHRKEDYIRALRININLYDDFIELEKEIGKPAGANGEWLADYKKEVLNEKK